MIVFLLIVIVLILLGLFTPTLYVLAAGAFTIAPTLLVIGAVIFHAVRETR